ncbi:hypothetical protein MPL1_12035 [Methylophaga lonarensis MPL]|uniref:Uncharacterized protein n=1 Tax=Methylophaga lonarensis MPL TaxID=1286106 RepID=M7PNS6_9GAMM|nr:hypothetical protein [Methylophaga lonarensis]EMR12124.1 hypothetical protein MPL1_12035 [Methylophaga lonarensis MPL]
MSETQQAEVKTSKIRTLLRESDIPLVVYLVVFTAMAVVWSLNTLMPDLALNLFSELLGAAFTLFIIDVLLVRSKTKRWRTVSEHIDYLIARDINRLRDGLSFRAFNFNPELDAQLHADEQHKQVRAQRADLLNEIEGLSVEAITARLNPTVLFTDSSFDYFNDKAVDIWNLLNMKYSEFLSPELVACLIELHTNLRDLCGHIRQYSKADRHTEDSDYYHAIGIRGAAHTLKKCVSQVNQLKQAGYSVHARTT